MAGGGNSRKRCRGDEQICNYLTNRAFNVASKFRTTKQKNKYVSGCSNGAKDSNLHQLFVWRQKIKRDIAVSGGGDMSIDAFSVKSLKRRQAELMADFQKLQKIREENAIQKAQREEEKALLASDCACAEFSYWEKKEEEFLVNQAKLRSQISRQREPDCKEAVTEATGTMEDGEHLLGSAAEVIVDSHAPLPDQCTLRKPKHFNRVHTGYEWNRYNRTHYDHDNPPPKFVKVQVHLTKILHSEWTESGSILIKKVLDLHLMAMSCIYSSTSNVVLTAVSCIVNVTDGRLAKRKPHLNLIVLFFLWKMPCLSGRPSFLWVL